MICNQCKKAEAVEGKTRCQACVDYGRNYNREYYQRLRANRPPGTCFHCSRPTVDGKSLCEIHGAMAREHAVSQSKDRKEAGLCKSCGKSTGREGIYCQPCTDIRYEKRMAKRVAMKAKAVAYLGGQCMDCGLISSHLNVYDFHHRDPATKALNPAKAMYKSWPIIKAELDKCDLLCANCHRIRHGTEDTED